MKYEIASIGVLKGAKVTLCGMRCVNPNEDTNKILGIHYSYNKTAWECVKFVGSEEPVTWRENCSF